MTILTWHGKEDTVRKARKTPYYLLREVPEFSHNLGDSLAKIMPMSMKILSFKAII